MTMWSNYYTGQDINLIIKSHPDVLTFNLLAGEYKISTLIYGTEVSRLGKFTTIRGVGIDKTIIRGWDFVNNVENISLTASLFEEIKYENLTIKNRGFQQYGGSGIDQSGKKAEFVNLKLEYTFNRPSSYAVTIVADGMDVTFSGCEFKCYADTKLYAGVWCSGNVNLVINDVKIGDYFTKPFVCEGVSSPQVSGLHTIGGTTGIFFGANKLRPLDGFLVQDCIADGAEEECLSFDTYGNNVSLNPCIAELSVLSASIVGDKLKMYCDARTIEGTHPNEYYQALTFTGHEEYLERFYVYFSQLSGDDFEGQVVKVLDADTDEGGQFIIADTSTLPTTLTLENYKAVSIIGGFFNGIVRNSIVRNGGHTGLALFCSFFNNIIDGNTVTNCPVNGSYLYKAFMLAKGVWNGANGNTITNNNFEDGFKIISYGNCNGYNNTYTGNTGIFQYANEVNLTTDEV